MAMVLLTKCQQQAIGKVLSGIFLHMPKNTLRKKIEIENELQLKLDLK